MSIFRPRFAQEYPQEGAGPSLAHLGEVMDRLADMTREAYGAAVSVRARDGPIVGQGWMNRTCSLPSGTASYSLAYWLAPLGADGQESRIRKVEVLVDVRTGAPKRGLYNAIGDYLRSEGLRLTRRG